MREDEAETGEAHKVGRRRRGIIAGAQAIGKLPIFWPGPGLEDLYQSDSTITIKDREQKIVRGADS